MVLNFLVLILFTADVIRTFSINGQKYVSKEEQNFTGAGNVTLTGNITKSPIIEYIGRFSAEQPRPQQRRGNWPHSGCRFQIRSEHDNLVKIKVLFGNCIDDCKFFVNAEIDCKFFGKYEISANSSSSIELSVDATRGEDYLISLRKATEAHYSDAQGELQVDDIYLKGAEFVPVGDSHGPTSVDNSTSGTSRKIFDCIYSYKMLVIGDSISAGYGVDGMPPCSFAAELEDVTHGFAYLVAQNVHADLHVIAWSGKGVVRNYGDSNTTSTDPMPAYYNRTIATLPVEKDYLYLDHVEKGKNVDGERHQQPQPVMKNEIRVPTKQPTKRMPHPHNNSYHAAKVNGDRDGHKDGCSDNERERISIVNSRMHENYWDPHRFPANVVLVMLGTNDYSTEPFPSDKDFIDGLVDFLQRILQDYPQAQVAAMCAPMANGNQCKNIEIAARTVSIYANKKQNHHANTKINPAVMSENNNNNNDIDDHDNTAVAAAAGSAGSSSSSSSSMQSVQYIFIDPSSLDGGFGCDGHPNRASQQNIADIVTPVVQSMLNSQRATYVYEYFNTSVRIGT
mmetsp:Transcript_20418/g.34190  ORF Transcript_20418/g.34190 Transcript_20418/m.34190 type:complete len:565 (+) Transcript_20418:109-1803(+)